MIDCVKTNRTESISAQTDACNTPGIATVMSWGRTEGIPRFYIFGEDSASAYVLRHQTSTVLEFQARDRRGFRGLDDEFEGQSMLISD